MHLEHSPPPPTHTPSNLNHPSNPSPPSPSNLNPFLLTEIHLEAQKEPDWFGEDDEGGAAIDPIDHEQWKRSNGRQKDLVPPAKVKHIISKSKKDHTTDGKEGTNELGKLEKERTKEKLEVKTMLTSFYNVVNIIVIYIIYW